MVEEKKFLVDLNQYSNIQRQKKSGEGAEEREAKLDMGT